MEHFLSYNNNSDKYSDKITINKYTQGENECKVNVNILKSNNILEIVLSKKDYNYQILSPEEKSNYVQKKSLELSTFIDLNYDNYNYHKRKFNKNLLTRSLQLKNQLSAILFYNDYYNINIIICNKIYDMMKLYKTGLKDLEYMFIEYNDNNFNHINESDLNIEGDIKYNLSKVNETMGPVDDPYYSLENVINFDIKDNIIYNLYLKPITNYKVEELSKLASEFDINVKKENGKKKTKKELFDDINLSKF